MKIKNLPVDKQLLIGSLLCAVYFATLHSIYYFKLETILVGVIKEMLTIPILLLMCAIIIGGIYFLFKKNGTPLVIIAAMLIVMLTAIGLTYIK